jgi:hypothetical protein
MNKKRLYFELTKLFVAIVSIPLWFVKFIKYVSTLPNVNGDFDKFNYYFSLYGNLKDGSSTYLFYITLTTTISLIVLTGLSLLKKSNKTIKWTSNIVFVVFIILYTISIIVGFSVSRGF